MWFLILVQMTGTIPNVYPLAYFTRYEDCMFELHQVEFGIQGQDEGLLCLEASKDEVRDHF
jgi:hypothetical protein